MSWKLFIEKRLNFYEVSRDDSGYFINIKYLFYWSKIRYFLFRYNIFFLFFGVKRAHNHPLMRPVFFLLYRFFVNFYRFFFSSHSGGSLYFFCCCFHNAHSISTFSRTQSNSFQSKQLYTASYTITEHKYIIFFHSFTKYYILFLFLVALLNSGWKYFFCFVFIVNTALYSHYVSREIFSIFVLYEENKKYFRVFSTKFKSNKSSFHNTTA